MPPRPTERSFYHELVRALGATALVDQPCVRVRATCDALLRAANPRMLIIEDLHLLRGATRMKRRVLLNTLRFLANAIPMSVVGVGTDDARIALLEDEQLADRFEALDLTGIA